MTESERCHEQAIERALLTLEPDGLGATLAPRLVADDEAQVAALAQEYTELAALLAYAHEPETPNHATRARLLATLSGHGPQASPVVAHSSHRPAPVHRESRGTSPWALALAAMLGLCLMGLAYFAGQQRDPGTPLAALQPRTGQTLAPAPSDVDAVMRAHATVVDRLTQVEKNLYMVTNVARSVYPMHQVTSPTHPTHRPARSQRLDGKIFVCGRHQQWYLNVSGLTPPPTGHAYQLWFITEDGPVAAGVLEVAARQSAELGAGAMPPSTNGFAITLEPMAGPRDVATALLDPILVADQPINL